MLAVGNVDAFDGIWPCSQKVRGVRRSEDAAGAALDEAAFAGIEIEDAVAERIGVVYGIDERAAFF